MFLRLKDELRLWRACVNDLFLKYFCEVLQFNMTRLSLFSLIFGFMFLGVLFFFAGFLTAVSLYENASQKRQVSKQIERDSSSCRFPHPQDNLESNEED
jgi:hypothetical protein